MCMCVTAVPLLCRHVNWCVSLICQPIGACVSLLYANPLIGVYHRYAIDVYQYCQLVIDVYIITTSSHWCTCINNRFTHWCVSYVNWMMRMFLACRLFDMCHCINPLVNVSLLCQTIDVPYHTRSCGGQCDVPGVHCSWVWCSQFPWWVQGLLFPEFNVPRNVTAVPEVGCSQSSLEHRTSRNIDIVLLDANQLMCVSAVV